VIRKAREHYEIRRALLRAGFGETTDFDENTMADRTSPVLFSTAAERAALVLASLRTCDRMWQNRRRGGSDGTANALAKARSPT
jgi:hypothetical protein